MSVTVRLPHGQTKVVIPGMTVAAADIESNAVIAAKIAADAVTTAKILNANVTEAKITTQSLSGTVVKVAAADNVVGALPLLFRIDIAAGALATKNVVMTHKVRIIDVWVHLTGAGVANTTLTVGNVADIVTNAMAVSGSANAIVRASSLDASKIEIAAGTALRVITAVGATQPTCVVYVLALPVA